MASPPPPTAAWRRGDAPAAPPPADADVAAADADDADDTATTRSSPDFPHGRILARVQRAPVSLDALARWAAVPAAGAVSSFLGVTRDNFGGRPVLRLEYEGYAPMACTVMRQIAEQVFARWGDACRVGMVHRVGVVPVGEASVAIVVSSPHRRDSLEAVHFAIDQVKALVPIWKKEVYGTVAEASSSAEQPGGDPGWAGAPATSAVDGVGVGDGEREPDPPQWKVNKEWDPAAAAAFSRLSSS